MAVKTSTSATHTSTGRSGSATALLGRDRIPRALVSRRHRSIGPASEPAKGSRVDSVPTVNTIIDLTELKHKDQLHQAIRSLVAALFPDWVATDDMLSLKRVSGAMTNAVFFVTNQKEERKLLRVYGVGCDQLLDRAKELKWLSRLSRVGLGPRLLGKFGNGRFEEYLPSTTLTNEDIRSEETARQIAARLHQLHRIVRTYPPQPHTQLETWTNIDTWLAAIKEMSPDDRCRLQLDTARMEALKKGISRCKAILRDSKSPTVFAHNDTQYGNILRLEATDELVVIDFEYAGYNSRGFDIANHFCEWMYDYNCDEPAKMHTELFPTVEQQRTFLKAYLQGGDNWPSEGAVHALQREVAMWVMVSHLVWGLWGLIQAKQSEIDFDYLLYSTERLEAFQAELAKW